MKFTFLHLKIILLIAVFFSVQKSFAQQQPPAKNGEISQTVESNSVTLPLTSEEREWLRQHPLLKIAGPKAFPPFYFYTADGVLSGMAADYLHLISTMLHLKLEIQPNLPWPEVLQRAEAKTIDLIACAAKTPEREKFLLFSEPYMSFPLVIITTTSAPFIGGLGDLYNKKVTFVNKVSVYEWLKNDKINVDPLFVTSPQDALMAVSLGKADAHIENLAAASYIIQKDGLSNLKIAGPTSYGNYDLFMAFRHDWPELVPIFNKALAAITPQQHLEIRNRWLSVRYEHGINVKVVALWIVVLTGLSAAGLLIFYYWNRSLKKEIIERKKAEKALKSQKSTLDSIFRVAPTGIGLVVNRVIVEANDKLCLITGYSRAELLHQSARILYPTDEDFDFVGSEKYRQIAENQTGTVETRWQRKDKSIIDVLLSSTPVDMNDLSQGVTFTALDITHRKILEEKLRQSSKMEAIGTLAGGVAHDLNNILTGIVSYPDLLLLDMPTDNPYRKPIMTIQESGKKAAAIVDDLLTLARRGVAVKDIINLNSLISAYLQTPEHHKLMSHHTMVDICLDLAENLKNIEGSPFHLTKTIMNLVANSAESITGKGSITIRTENRIIPKNTVDTGGLAAGEYAVVTLSDSGAGITPENLDRIYEPFFTNKKMGRSGSGLGLAVVWGTVHDHNGHIDVQSVEEKGTIFTLSFPVTKKELPEPDLHPSVKEYSGNGQSILIIDDTKSQREIATELLTKLGYTVHSVPSGEDAVDYLKENSADLLLLDMIMAPGIDGLDTYKRILAFKPQQKAIITSGYSETKRVKEARQMGAKTYLKKPYSLEEVGIAIKKELER